jgi:hypothetical protein
LVFFVVQIQLSKRMQTKKALPCYGGASAFNRHRFWNQW